MYCCRCPANRGAIQYPFAEGFPWHQVQFLVASVSSASTGPPAEKTTARSTIFIFSSFIVRVLAESRLHLSAELLQGANICCNGCDLRLIQVVCSRRHNGGYVSFLQASTSFLAPIRQRFDGVRKELTCQTRNFLMTFSFRPMTGGACRDIRFGYSVVEYWLALCHEVLWRLFQRVSLELAKIRGQSRYHRRVQGTRHIRHDRARPPALNEGPQLILEVLGLLSRESWHGKISAVTLPRQPVAGFAIFQLGLKLLLGKGHGAPVICVTGR